MLRRRLGGSGAGFSGADWVLAGVGFSSGEAGKLELYLSREDIGFEVQNGDEKCFWGVILRRIVPEKRKI